MLKTHQREVCLITGVAGFVGSHLAERLLTLGREVIGVDNFFSGRRENLQSFMDHPSFHFHEASITEARLLSTLKSLYPDLSHCFHLAAIVSVPYSMEHPGETMQINYEATSSLAQQAVALNLKSFVFAGSAAEYGNEQRSPLKEEYAADDNDILSPYGRSKFLASRRVAREQCGVSLRCFNIFGPRQDPASPYSGVISRFVDMVLAGKSLTVFGDGLQTRDFIYVSDVVEAYVSAAGLQGRVCLPFSGIYNIGTGNAVSVLDLARTILMLNGQSVAADSFVFLPERSGDIRHSLAAVDCFKAASGWEPSVAFEEGLQRTLHWARRRV